MTKIITFVTGNKNKLREVQNILGASPNASWSLESKSLDVPEVQGSTQEVALAKCRSAAQQLQGPCLTEDTALSFRALNGLPGPYIKDFLHKLGLDGLNRLLAGFDDKGATAICTFAYCEGPGFEPVLFEGKTLGHIVPPRGPTDFGWDPVFEVDGHGKTFAEMDKSEKNAVSHRFRALSQFQSFLNSK
ncbi:Similar to S.cerevisiae protein HAM1 (Nucleoside triphosphate pyrophosphohydrolase) [Malassezia sympodialis ATCC 42132]|uniref:Inosine triphosphate pyrophosphatase n=1 Tax=Malassezia sympodialis (strain ATCC 42132) TaxID=1230383 RepID=A0A1M8A9H9_MALS4|nr:Similar to S.cerevisiae protein HAM1 (Nucleoside triphosphate pyrophosphohydrolase) [Malassezia sympodialis ATCC 42132]